MNISIYTNPHTGFLAPLGYLEADTGTFKSTTTGKWVIARSRFNLQIVVCEKRDLLNEWEAMLKTELEQQGLSTGKVVKIHKDSVKDFVAGWIGRREHAGKSFEDLATIKTVNGAVSHWLKQHTGSNNSCEGVAGAPSILLITQATLENLTDFDRRMKSQCEIWIDELPGVDNDYKVKVKNNPAEVKDFLQLSKDPVFYCKTKVPVIVDGEVSRYKNDDVKYKKIDDTVHAVEPISTNALKNHLTEKGHNIGQKAVEDLLKATLSNNKTVYVERSQWDLMDHKFSKVDDQDQGETFFFAMAKRKILTGWKSCTVISADFSKSIFSHWMTKRHRVNFTHHNQMMQSLSNGGRHAPDLIDRVHFVVLMTEKEEAKQARNSKRYLEDHGKLIDSRLVDLLNPVSDKVLICTNKDRKDGRELLKRDYETITSKDLGSNRFQDCHHVVFDAALNPNPKQKKMLNLFGIDDDLIYQDKTLNVMYQIASRSSLRNKNSKEPVFIYCMNMESADALARRFAANNPDAKMNVRRFDETKFKSVSIGDQGMASPIATRPHVDENHSQCEFSNPPSSIKGEPKTRTSPHHKGFKEITDSHNGFSATPTAQPSPWVSALSNGETAVTLYQKKNSESGEVINLKFTKFVKWLKKYHDQEVHDRSNRPHLSPAMVQESESGAATRQRRSTSRGYANFVGANVFVVDFDGHAESNHETAVTASQFTRCFNGNKNKGEEKCCFVICSTHNTEGHDPYKFRAFFHLKQPATTIEEYKACYRFIDETLAKHGHGHAPYNGLDTNSQSPVKLYYVPGTNVELKEYAFFETVNLNNDNRNAVRYGLDPVELLEQYPPTPTVEYKNVNGKPKAKTGFNLESVKGQYRALVDGRRLGLKQAGKRMATTGAMGPGDVERELLSLVDTNDPDMLKRVQDTMTQLSKEVQWWG